MSRPFLCLACWRLLAPEQTLYRCAACAVGEDLPPWLARGGEEVLRPSAEHRGPWYRRWLEDDGAAPSCSRHGETEIDLFCLCSHPLTARSTVRSGGRPLALGFAGPTGAGKTLLIIAMIRALRQLEVERHAVGALGVDGTEERFHTLSAGFLQEGVRPRATEPEPWGAEGLDGAAAVAPSAHGNFAWEVFVEDGGRRRQAPALLSVFDLAGETWGLPVDQRVPRFDRYLRQIASLVFVVDGAALAADLGWEGDDAWDRQPRPADGGAADLAWLTRVVDRLGTKTRSVELALVVSKIDLLWDHPSAAALAPGAATDEEARVAALEDLLVAAGRRDLLLAARNHFRAVAPFGCSSLGFRPQGSDVDSTGRLVRATEPVAVAAPLTWLLRHRFPRLGA